MPFQKASIDRSCCNGIEKATVPVKKIPGSAQWQSSKTEILSEQSEKTCLKNEQKIDVK